MTLSLVIPAYNELATLREIISRIGAVEGKKIGWKDGVRALYCIAKYGVRRSPH